MSSPVTPPNAPLSPELPPRRRLLRRLIALAWVYRRRTLVVLAQQGLLVALSTFALSLTGLGIDVLRSALDPAAGEVKFLFGLRPPTGWSTFAVVAAIAGVTLLLATGHALLRFWATISSSRLAQMIVVRLRTDVYDKLQRLSFRFFDANESGTIINRVTGDVQAVRMFIDGVVIQILTVLLSLAIYLAYMLSMNVPLTLACLATTPLLGIGAIIFARTVRPGYVRNSELVDRLVRVVSENVQGALVVRGFAREPEEIEKFLAASKDVQRQKHRIFWQVSVFQPLMGLLTQLNMVVLLGYGGYLVIQGRLPLGAGLFVFANLLHQFANQIGQITNIASSIQTSLTGAERVFAILDAPVEIQSPAIPIRLPKALGEIRFEHVSFAYHPGETVLRDITFSVAAGECVAIVGLTGAGKTTLLNLVPRLYDVSVGRVLLDGIDVRDLDLDELRRNVGLVFQESFIFSNTVAANVAFGRPQATLDRIQEAATIAAAHSFIAELPAGYDTVIGEYGANLSGGQRQRLAIARAVLLDPAVLILDDALAAIDPETEHEILSALNQITEQRTTLIVAHRLSTLRRADRIVVLEHGRIVDIGTHAELLARSLHYRRAARLQLAPDETPHPRRQESV